MKTQTRVRRSNFKVMKLNDQIVTAMNGISKSISVAKVDDADANEEPHVEEEAEVQSLHDEVHVPGQHFEYVTEVEDNAAIQDEEAEEALQPIQG